MARKKRKIKKSKKRSTGKVYYVKPHGRGHRGPKPGKGQKVKGYRRRVPRRK